MEILQLCSSCDWTEAWNSGTRLETVMGGRCGVDILEELRVLTSMYTAGASQYADYSKFMAASAMKPISDKQFKVFSKWIAGITLSVFLGSIVKYRQVVAEREVGTLGSWINLVIKMDEFWSKACKRNHTGDSR